MKINQSKEKIMNKILRWIVYLVNRLHLEFMSKLDMYTYLSANNLIVNRRDGEYSLIDITSTKPEGLTGRGYCSLEECVKAVIEYHRDK